MGNIPPGPKSYIANGSRADARIVIHDGDEKRTVVVNSGSHIQIYQSSPVLSIEVQGRTVCENFKVPFSRFVKGIHVF